MHFRRSVCWYIWLALRFNHRTARGLFTTRFLCCVLWHYITSYIIQIQYEYLVQVPTIGMFLDLEHVINSLISLMVGVTETQLDPIVSRREFSEYNKTLYSALPLIPLPVPTLTTTVPQQDIVLSTLMFTWIFEVFSVLFILCLDI